MASGRAHIIIHCKHKIGECYRHTDELLLRNSACQAGDLTETPPLIT